MSRRLVDPIIGDRAAYFPQGLQNLDDAVTVFSSQKVLKVQIGQRYARWCLIELVCCGDGMENTHGLGGRLALFRMGIQPSPQPTIPLGVRVFDQVARRAAVFDPDRYQNLVDETQEQMIFAEFSASQRWAAAPHMP